MIVLFIDMLWHMDKLPTRQLPYVNAVSNASWSRNPAYLLASGNFFLICSPDEQVEGRQWIHKVTLCLLVLPVISSVAI